MISAYNYFRRLRELKKKQANNHSVRDDLYEIFRELPVGSKKMVEKIIEDNSVDALETDHIREYIYREGEPRGYDIRLLFEIHDHTHGNQNDTKWEKLFLEETMKYFSAKSDVTKKLPLAKAAMLLDLIKNSIRLIGMMSEVEMTLMKNIIENTGDVIFQNKTDSHFLSALYEEILKDYEIDFNEVEMLKEMVYQDKPPMREDLELLFEINQAIMDKPRDDMWQVFFIESVSLYMIDNKSEIDKQKVHWLETKLDSTIEQHKCLTSEEKELLNTLKEQTALPAGLEYYLTKYCN